MLIAEATEYEFKSALELKKPKSWLKTVSTFASRIDGSVYFGVVRE
jgi:ATP-dependent DNA helicase RecG